MQVCQVSASSSIRFLRRRILIFFSKIYPLCRPVNQSNQAIWTKVAQNMDDYHDFQDIKETKRYRHTHTHSRRDGQLENSIPIHKQFAGGINRVNTTLPCLFEPRLQA